MVTFTPELRHSLAQGRLRFMRQTCEVWFDDVKSNNGVNFIVLMMVLDKHRFSQRIDMEDNPTKEERQEAETMLIESAWMTIENLHKATGAVLDGS